MERQLFHQLKEEGQTIGRLGVQLCGKHPPKPRWTAQLLERLLCKVVESGLSNALLLASWGRPSEVFVQASQEQLVKDAVYASAKHLLRECPELVVRAMVEFRTTGVRKAGAALFKQRSGQVQDAIVVALDAANRLGLPLLGIPTDGCFLAILHGHRPPPSICLERPELHVDFTFKMLQEQIPFAVTSVPDLQQHVHLSTLGPCTHQDADMMRLIFNAIKVSIEKLVRMIIAHDTPNSCWPSNWPPALIIELVDSYKDLIIAGLKQSGIDYYAGLDLDKDITYEPGGIMADAADAIGNGARAVWPDVNVRMCWPHVWRAVKGNHWRLKKNTEQQQRTLYEDLNFIHELTVPELVPIAMAKFYAKWRKMGEGAMVNYIKNEWEARNWTRADGEAGEPGDNNTLESLNRGLKSDPSFAKTTSLGLCLKSCLTVVHRYSRDAKPLASIDAPVVKKETWVKAQKLNDTSFFKMGYKMDNKIVIPASKLLDACPGKSVAERRQNMSVWVKEYVSLMKNPGGYYKLHGAQSWDFDTLIDYAYSFYVIEPIDPSVHRHYGALASAGIMYKCNCPQFMHYYNCKHAVGYALYTNGVHAPTVFSTKTVGKRKAPAGAKSGKRSHCLAIDN